MNFYRKHTYLIWQLIGWGLLLAAFIVMVVNLHDYHHDSVLGSFVFLTIFGTFAIFVSPLVIWLRKRDKAEQERNRCIMELNFKRHPAVEILAVILIFLIFLAVTMVIARLGLFYLFPLAFYLAALPYCLFRYNVKKIFYQIPDAESFCQVFEVMEPEVLAYFEQTPTFVYFGIVPDERCGFSTTSTANAALCVKTGSAWFMCDARCRTAVTARCFQTGTKASGA